MNCLPLTIIGRAILPALTTAAGIGPAAAARTLAIAIVRIAVILAIIAAMPLWTWAVPVIITGVALFIRRRRWRFRAGVAAKAENPATTASAANPAKIFFFIIKTSFVVPLCS